MPKGQLLITAALELSTNQITHFYSTKKNTGEMIKLLMKLLRQYPDEKTIFISWDTASWHVSKALQEKVNEINNTEERRSGKSPLVKLTPLPASAQFLNVIESVYSGMCRAIIHTSDYQSIEECKTAIGLLADTSLNGIRNSRRTLREQETRSGARKGARPVSATAIIARIHCCPT